MTSPVAPFHLAVPVRDLEDTRRFYGKVLGFTPGRSSETWTDFSRFGHRMSADLRPGMTVPIPHFGVVLAMDD